MKKIIILISIFILSCSPNNNGIETIEIMSYYYDLNESQTEFKTEFVTYSIINENGNVETIQKTPFSKKVNLNFKSTVDRKIIDKVYLNSKNKNEEYYNKRLKNPSIEVSCGPIIRIKIKYKTQKEITFNYSENKADSRFKEFIELQRAIQNNYSEKRFNKIEKSIELEKKQKDFEKYTLNKDTLNFPFPPLPQRNPIKFTK